MHRPPVIAVLALLLASVPLWAQRGGGHGSAGGHGGGFAAHGSSGGGHSFGGGHASGGRAFGGTHSFSGAHSGAHSRAFAPRSFNRGSSLRASRSSRGRNQSGVGVRIRTRGFRNNCYGYGCGWWGYGYPYLGGGIDPYWWWDHDSSSDQEYAGAANDAGPYDQRGDQGDQDSYARSAPPRAPEGASAGPNTVLVFRDQHKQEVQNYAIVGQTLWIFAPQRTQKVALGDLDLDATHKANDDRGVDFRVPRAGEGQ